MTADRQLQLLADAQRAAQKRMHREATSVYDSRRAEVDDDDLDGILAAGMASLTAARHAASRMLAAEAGKKRVIARNAKEETPAPGSEAASRLADAQAILAGSAQ